MVVEYCEVYEAEYFLLDLAAVSGFLCSLRSAFQVLSTAGLFVRTAGAAESRGLTIIVHFEHGLCE